MEVVLNSILYLFGLGKNPLPQQKKISKKSSDFDAIMQDWVNVGKDIQSAMIRYEEQ